ncbi:PREDICTED: epidermal growth factor receptor substrate 15-like 1 [Priapulus caudatus]|uniref:Epidermal growth factor receptor substrate 15-like 1 n=1 Tax=Priapulus caudatus TaxID=37621 RepID=A0ABM1E784_PRICU|nr:PREDICTED: epidermal growth factor receptor substrate 15-like 1 [Priapulus caudatus]
MACSPPSLSAISGHRHNVYEALWSLADAAGSGSVGALDAANILKKSKLSDSVLGKIWDLSDRGAKGFLDKECFFTAMKLVALAQNGKEVSLLNIRDNTIAAPSLGDYLQQQHDGWAIAAADRARWQQMFDALGPRRAALCCRRDKEAGMVGDAAIAKEIDVIARELEELAKEKLVYEQDITQTQADIRIRTGEMKSLQSELDTLSVTATQLENQKGEAQKRLDELDLQRTKLDNTVQDLKQKCDEEAKAIRDVKQQLATQVDDVKGQAEQLAESRVELTALRRDEHTLQTDADVAATELDKVGLALQQTQTTMSKLREQVKSTETMRDDIEAVMRRLDSCLASSDVTGVDDADLSATYRLSPSVQQQLAPSLTNGPDHEAFGASKMPDLVAGGDDEAFAEADPFKGDDPFTNHDVAAAAEAFGGDPFRDTMAGDAALASDPFEAADPFANATPSSTFDSDAVCGRRKRAAAPSRHRCRPDQVGRAPRDLKSARGLRRDPTNARSESPAAPCRGRESPMRRPRSAHLAPAFGATRPPSRAPVSKVPNVTACGDPADPWGGAASAAARRAPCRLAFGGSARLRTSGAAACREPLPTRCRIRLWLQKARNLAMRVGRRGGADFEAAFVPPPSSPPKTTERAAVATATSTTSSGKKSHMFGFKSRSSLKKEKEKEKKEKLASARGMSEDDQLAWATSESRHLEEDKRKQRALQEQQDLELAIALSKAESENARK